MRTFRADQNRLGIKNPERADESLIFEQMLEHLRREKIIELGDMEVGPYVDIVKGTVEGNSFEAFFDLDYGAGVRCDDPGCLAKIEELLND